MYGRKIQIVDTCLSSIPLYLDTASLPQLIELVDSISLCPGNPDAHFLEMGDARKGKFNLAVIDDTIPVKIDDKTYSRTVRAHSCKLIVGVSGARCSSCKLYRNQLRATYSRWMKKSPTVKKFANNRYLNTPQKQEKLKNLQSRAMTAEKELKQLKEKIASSADRIGTSVDSYLHADLKQIITENQQSIHDQFPEGSFRRLFWDQQAKVASVADARQMRWHPIMVRWCLNLKLLSSGAYHALRSSGFVQLPSERTLNDYTHYIKSKPGFQQEVDEQLATEAGLATIPEWKKYVVLLIDEMKIKESLVYDKHSAEVIGFVDLGSFNEQLADLENKGGNDSGHAPVATHVLALMVRGLFLPLSFPMAHFPTNKLTADKLFVIIWEAVERLERLGFKVIAITGDGASINRKFFKMHSGTHTAICYKTVNPYADDSREMFFVSDVPHLVKTTRNCWSHSYGHGYKRKLWVSFQIVISYSR